MDIKEYIKESVRQVIREDVERQAIREIVKNELRKMYNEGVFEGGKPENNNDNNKKKETDAAATGIGQLKAFFNDNPMIKKSQVAYQVLDGVDPDSARHIYNDILDGEDPAPKGFVNNSFDAIRNGIGGK